MAGAKTAMRCVSAATPPPVTGTKTLIAIVTIGTEASQAVIETANASPTMTMMVGGGGGGSTTDQNRLQPL